MVDGQFITFTVQLCLHHKARIRQRVAAVHLVKLYLKIVESGSQSKYKYQVGVYCISGTRNSVVLEEF